LICFSDVTYAATATDLQAGCFAPLRLIPINAQGSTINEFYLHQPRMSRHAAQRTNLITKNGTTDVSKKHLEEAFKTAKRAALATLAVAGAIASLPGAATAASTITISGTVLPNCGIAVTPNASAANLDLTSSGPQHVTVGTVLQSCNKMAGYTIVVTSANCATPTPAGAKLIGTAPNTDTLSYSVEAQNPVTGGSQAVVTGLLASSCTGQNARAVTNAKISTETSTIFINYNGSASLNADTYQDTLTFTVIVN
jgi:hypothetical protein